MQAALQEATDKVALEHVKGDYMIQAKRIEAESKGDIEELKGYIQMLLQNMQPPPVLANDVSQDLIEDDMQPSGNQQQPYQPNPNEQEYQ